MSTRLRHDRRVRYHAVPDVVDQGEVGDDDLIGAELSGDKGDCDVSGPDVHTR